jgi:hypothetical protein
MGTPSRTPSDGKKSAIHSTSWILPSLDVLTGLIALAALLPIAGGLPAIASAGDALTDGMWLTAILGGPLLLLGGGLNQLFPSVPSPWFVVIFVATIGLIGIIRL